MRASAAWPPGRHAMHTWNVKKGATLGSIVGAIYGASTAAALAWHFRGHILTPPSVGHVQLYDPLSKIIGFLPHVPGNLLNGFYGPGLIAKAPLVLELAIANGMLGAVLGMVLAMAIRMSIAAKKPWLGNALFATGFLALCFLLHLVTLVPAVVDPQRPRPLTFILARLAERMVTDGPAVNLALAAVALMLGLVALRGQRQAHALRVPVITLALAMAALVTLGKFSDHEDAIAAKGPISAASLPAKRPRNVVLISIDSLRANHLGCYGYEKPTSPVLDRLAAEGSIFASAYAPTSWTLPSHATMMTGRYPLSHGTVLRDQRLSPALPTLATVLGQAGYTTAGFVSFEFLRRRYGFDRGFGYFDDFTTDFDTVEEEQSRTTGPLLNDQIIPWLDAHASRPFFLFIHYFDVHYHYNPPAPYDTMFDPGYVGPDLRHFTKNPAIFPGMPKRNLQHLIALYDGEIRLTDHVVGEVIGTLERLGLGPDTLLVVTADHGEEFFEHGNKGHGTTLYGEVLRVPLIMRWPRGIGAGRRIEAPVSLVDLAPTIYELAGVTPPNGLEGHGLGSLLAADGPRTDTPIYAHLYTRTVPRIWAMVIQGNQKYIQNLNRPEAEMYDLTADPTESLNLISTGHARAQAATLLAWLRQQASASSSRPRGRRQVIIDQHNMNQLRALGYVN